MRVGFWYTVTSMRIAIVGPTHPYKGGIAKHTTELAHQLSSAQHDVEVFSWRAQYPFFYPGEQYVPDDKPELPLHAHTRRLLSWKNPASWLRIARQLKHFDKVIFVWWVPTIQGPVYWSIIRAMGRKRPSITVVCHNVLPHEPKPGDKRFAKAVLGAADHIVVHAKAQAGVAQALTDTPVYTTKLPLILPVRPGSIKKTARKGLVFFGLVRPYKGVNVLLRALAQVPKVRLTVAGEFWGGTEPYEQLLRQLQLEKRVRLQAGYLPDMELAKLISRAEAVVLPYTSGTATWNATLAHAYGTPVIATTASSLSEQVRDGVDGLLCRPADVEALAQTIEHFYEPGVAETLQKGIPPVNPDADWRDYIAIVAKE